MDRKILDFTIFVLYQLAQAWHIPAYKAYEIINKSGALKDYLIPCYDVLHTQGREYLVEDFTEYVQAKGYNV